MHSAAPHCCRASSECLYLILFLLKPLSGWQEGPSLNPKPKNPRGDGGSSSACFSTGADKSIEQQVNLLNRFKASSGHIYSLEVQDT